MPGQEVNWLLSFESAYLSVFIDSWNVGAGRALKISWSILSIVQMKKLELRLCGVVQAKLAWTLDLLIFFPHLVPFHQGCPGSLEALGLQNLFWPMFSAPTEQGLKIGQRQLGNKDCENQI